MKQENIDCMKYRKSTHIAGIDVETIINEKGKCVLTIKEAYYNTGVDVSGNKTDGYFLEFTEDVKPMVANSINRKTIASIVKIQKGRNHLYAHVFNKLRSPFGNINLKYFNFFFHWTKLSNQYTSFQKLRLL